MNDETASFCTDNQSQRRIIAGVGSDDQTSLFAVRVLLVTSVLSTFLALGRQIEKQKQKRKQILTTNEPI